MVRVKSSAPRLRAADQRTAKPAQDNPRSGSQLNFYSTPEWKALRARVYRERGNQCERCKRGGVRLFADHIIEIADGGAPLDPKNLRVLCGSCHGLKSNAERTKRITTPV